MPNPIDALVTAYGAWRKSVTAYVFWRKKNVVCILSLSSSQGVATKDGVFSAHQIQTFQGAGGRMHARPLLLQILYILLYQISNYCMQAESSLKFVTLATTGC